VTHRRPWRCAERIPSFPMNAIEFNQATYERAWLRTRSTRFPSAIVTSARWSPHVGPRIGFWKHPPVGRPAGVGDLQPRRTVRCLALRAVEARVSDPRRRSRWGRSTDRADRPGHEIRAAVRVERAEASAGRDGIDAQHVEAGALPRARTHAAADASEHTVRGRLLVERGIRDDAPGLVATATGADVLKVAARVATGRHRATDLLRGTGGEWHRDPERRTTIRRSVLRRTDESEAGATRQVSDPTRPRWCRRSRRTPTTTCRSGA
jgi:hypothetical protein